MDDVGTAYAKREEEPLSAFSNHSVIMINGKIYDPSYGKIYIDLNDFEDKAIEGYTIGTNMKDKIKINGEFYQTYKIYFRKNENKNDLELY